MDDSTLSGGILFIIIFLCVCWAARKELFKAQKALWKGGHYFEAIQPLLYFGAIIGGIVYILR